MNLAVRLLLGALTGWLTGKAADGEGTSKVSSAASVQLRDALYGMVGALLGDSLFFWIVIGRAGSFSAYATAVLGAMTVPGAVRVIASRVHRSRHVIS